MVQRQRLQPIRQKQQTQARFPMPVGGLNFMASTMAMGPDDSYFLDNMIARPTGLEIRKGWRYWVPQANNFPSAVKTLLFYNAQDPVFSKLFASPAVGNGLIYDITASNAAPTLSLTPSTSATTPGEWYFTNFVTPAISVLCAVSQGAGYYVYDQTNGWREMVTGSGTDGISVKFPDTTTTKDLAYIWLWKNRLWFIKRFTAQCYYLPIGQFAGIAQLFDFGALLNRGGPLAFGLNWTYDAGDGVDDALVIVSQQGNVLIYEGTDPGSVATFSLKGVWYAGRMPYGRRNHAQYGGDIVMLTEYGMIRLSDLVSGKLHTTEIGGTIAIKLNPYMSRAISANLTIPYWFIVPYPTDELLVVGSPFHQDVDGTLIQFVMNSLTGAWNTISNVDLLCATVYQGNFIAGTRSGSVIRVFTGFLDGDDSAATGTGNEVTGRMQGAFLDMGSPNANKRVLRVKVYGIADGTPTVAVAFRSEYQLNEVLNVSAPVSVSGALWDSAIWDLSLWQAGQTSYRQWIGVAAYGKKVSFQIAARGAGQTLLTDYEVVFETGIGL